MTSWRVSMILVRNGLVSSNMEIRFPRCERTSWISSNGKIILAFCTFLSERAQIYNSFPKILISKTLDFVELDISSWNAAKMSEKWSTKTNLSLANGSVEDLPFADNSFDIVFHSGGINFFSDKAKVISEMIRVAKPSTKILIANETVDYIDSQYKKAHFLKNILTTQLLIYEKLKNAIPNSVHEKNLEFVWDKKFYVITFRK